MHLRISILYNFCYCYDFVSCLYGYIYQVSLYSVLSQDRKLELQLSTTRTLNSRVDLLLCKHIFHSSIDNTVLNILNTINIMKSVIPSKNSNTYHEIFNNNPKMATHPLGPNDHYFAFFLCKNKLPVLPKYDTKHDYHTIIHFL